MNVTAIIPARYASTRFPGKPLAAILGRPMIEHVYRRTAEATTVDRVIVATDDQRIFDAVMGFGGEARMTRADHPSGTDRLAEVAATLDAELIVNVQGDEPLIAPQMIDQAVQPLLDDPDLAMGTLCSGVETLEDYLSTNVVKVVRDLRGRALYFSRAPIPHPRDIPSAQLAQQLAQLGAWRHIGLYVYRRDLLLQYPQLEQTPLEQLESLEQLRALENGIAIHVAETACDCHGVDTPQDLVRVEKLLRQAAGS